MLLFNLRVDIVPKNKADIQIHLMLLFNIKFHYHHIWNNWIQIHLMLLFNTPAKYQDGSKILIQIHLMLLFNLLDMAKEAVMHINSNTSHVIIQLLYRFDLKYL